MLTNGSAFDLNAFIALVVVVLGIMIFLALVIVGTKLGRIADALELGNHNLERIGTQLGFIEQRGGHIMMRVEATHQNLGRIANVMESVHQDWKEELKDQEG